MLMEEKDRGLHRSDDEEVRDREHSTSSHDVDSHERGKAKGKERGVMLISTGTQQMS
jgi:hypothetical protein